MIESVILAVILFSWPNDAYAYIDPGTGSLFLQILIASVVSGLFVIKRFWNTIKGFFQNILNPRP